MSAPLSKSDLFGIVRNVCAVRRSLGLSLTAIEYLRYAAQCASAEDLGAGRAPWFYERVDDTASILDATSRTVHNIETRLVELGLIERSAMANGHRGARRCPHSGALLWVHGVSLAPLLARADEFAELAAAAAREEAAYRADRQKVHQLRARLQDAIASAAGLTPLAELCARAGALLETVPSRIERVSTSREDLARLRAQLQITLDALTEAREVHREPPAEAAADSSDAVENRPLSEKISDAPEIGFRHKYHTNSKGPTALSNPNGDKTAPASRGHAISGGADAPQGLEKGQRGAAGVNPQNPAPPLPDQIAKIPLDLVIQSASPDMTDAIEAQDAPGWRGLLQAAALLRPYIGVSEDGWTEACAELGREGAAVALVIADARRWRGELRAGRGATGAYLRGMIARARTGELWLARSLFSLARSVSTARDPSAAPGPRPS